MFRGLKSKMSDIKSKIGDIYRSANDIPETTKHILNDRGQYMTDIKDDTIYKAKETAKGTAYKAKNVVEPLIGAGAAVIADTKNYFATVDKETGAGEFWHTSIGSALDDISNETGILDGASTYEAPILKTAAGALLLTSLYNTKKNKENLDKAIQIGDMLNDLETKPYKDLVIQNIKTGKIPKGVLKELVKKPYLLSASDEADFKTGYNKKQIKFQEEIKEASNEILGTAEKYLDETNLLNRITFKSYRDTSKHKNTKKDNNHQAEELERQLYLLKDHADEVILDDTSNAIFKKILDGTLTYKLLDKVEKSMKKKNIDTRRTNLLRMYLDEAITDKDELKHYLKTDEPYEETVTINKAPSDITDEFGELKIPSVDTQPNKKDYPHIDKHLNDSIEKYANNHNPPKGQGTPTEVIEKAAKKAKIITKEGKNILKEKGKHGTDEELVNLGFPVDPEHKRIIYQDGDINNNSEPTVVRKDNTSSIIYKKMVNDMIKRLYYQK